jgi:hypothetical protein
LGELWGCLNEVFLEGKGLKQSLLKASDLDSWGEGSPRGARPVEAMPRLLITL